MGIARYVHSVDSAMARLISYMAPGFPESLFELIGDAIGATVEYETEMSGPAPGTDPFADSGAEFGWVCSTSFVDLATRGSDPSVQLVGVAWVPDDPDSAGRPVYFGDLVTRPGSEVSSINDLRGLRIGCNDVVSLSGHYALRFALDDAGISVDEVELVFTGGHHSSIDMMLAGDLDVAVVDSVVRTGRARLDPNVAALTVVERLGPWPVQPLVARSTLDPEQMATARRLLVEASDTPAMQAELDAAALSHFVEVGPDHYAPVRTAMDRIGAL